MNNFLSNLSNSFFFFFLLISLSQHFCFSQNFEKWCPYQSRPSNQFQRLTQCSWYNTETCCTPEETSEIVLWFEQFRATNWSTGCTKKLLTLKCGICSPNQKTYVSRIYENNMKLWELTLCWDFCLSLYQSCRNEPVLGVSVGSLWILPQDFCAALSTPALTFKVAPSPLSVSPNSPLMIMSCFSGRRTKASENSFVVQETNVSPFENFLEEVSSYDFVGVGKILQTVKESESIKETKKQKKYSKDLGYKSSGLVGERLSFRIQAVDWEFNELNYGGDVFVLVVDGPANIEYKIIDELNGQYIVEYEPKHSGKYQFNILTEERKPIANSPLFVYVSPVSLCPLQFEQFSLSHKSQESKTQCWWYKNNGCCDVENEIEIEYWLENEVYPTFGRESECSSMMKLLYCGYLCSPQQAYIVQYSPSTQTTVFSICSNFCNLLYHACKGHKMLSMSLQSIFQSPKDFCFSFRSVIGSDILFVTNPKHRCFNGTGRLISTDFTFAYGLGLGPELVVGSSYQIKIQAMTSDGNPKPEGGDKVRSEVYGTGVVTMSAINDLNNGIYEFYLTLSKSGVYLIHIFVNEQEILNSPYHIVAHPGEIDPSRSTLAHEELFTGRAGVQTRFSIQTRDRFDNIYHKGGQHISVHVTGPEHVPVEVKDNLDGTYSVYFTPTKSGGYVVVAHVENHPVVGSPYIFQIFPGETSPDNTIAYGPGLEMDAVQGSIGEFIIQTRDIYDNDRQSGNDIVAVDHSNPKTQSKIIDNSDGTYTVRYSREYLGIQLISVTIEGSAIIGSPFVVVVQQEEGVPREFEQIDSGESPWW